jgi:hypothetical protein
MTSNDIVEVIYNYESRTARGHSVVVQPGEKYILISDANNDWWYVAKECADSIDEGFYLPATFVKKLPDVDITTTFKPRHSAIIPSTVEDANANRVLQAPVPTSTTKSHDGSFRSGKKSPGFWMANNPNRFSRSIPIELDATEPEDDDTIVSDLEEIECSNPVMESTLIEDVSVPEIKTTADVHPVPAPRRSLERESSRRVTPTPAIVHESDCATPMSAQLSLAEKMVCLFFNLM